MSSNDASRLLDLAAIQAERARRSLKYFAQAVWPIIEPMPFVDGWCLDAIVEHLEAVAAGDIRKIVINIPPRHTKSLLLVIWRAWLWTQNPAERILAASYSYALSIRDNARVRRILEDPWFQSRFGSEWHWASDQNAKTHFENSERGYQMAISVAGGTTGQGGSVLICDDLHNAAEAHSEADRETAVTWFREVWTNRLNDQAKDKMVTVGQRIHEKDVCGYILAERPDWVHLNLPAEFEPARRCITSIGWRDPREREGDLLWPERFNREALAGLKRDLGSAGYAAQYQQSPVPASGGQFKQHWFRYFEEQGDHYLLHTGDNTKGVAKKKCRLFAVCDPAISSRQEADYTVIQVWAQTPDNELLLLAQIREHLDNPEQQKAIYRLYDRFHFTYLAVETVGYQLALFQQLRRGRTDETGARHGIPVKEYKPVRDKVARASVAAIKFEAGDMYLLAGADYLPALEAELLKFPKDAHDDQVDGCAMAADLTSSAIPSAQERLGWADRYAKLLAGTICERCGAEIAEGTQHVCGES